MPAHRSSGSFNPCTRRRPPACVIPLRHVDKARELLVRIFLLMAMACLSGCFWHGSRKPPPLPDPPQIIVTGAPAGSTVLVDGVQIGQATSSSRQPQTFEVAAGAHKVEIQSGGHVVYREDTYVRSGERSVVVVKSGSSP
jgi:hypothetical protein